MKLLKEFLSERCDGCSWRMRWLTPWGVSTTVRATGWARSTISRSIAELRAGATGSVRRRARSEAVARWLWCISDRLDVGQNRAVTA